MESSTMRHEEQENSPQIEVLKEDFSRGKSIEEGHSDSQAPAEGQSGDKFEEKEIIIKCGLDEMMKTFFKEFVIVWHDPLLDSEENQKYLAQLKNFCKILTFSDWQKASAWIYEAKQTCHVITSGDKGKPFAQEISPNSNVKHIYVFCRDKTLHSNWTSAYPKVSCIETRIENILSQIQKNLLVWYKEKSSLKLNLPAFAPIFNDTDKSEMNDLHFYLKVIPNFKNQEQGKKDFVALSRRIYSDPESHKEIIGFENDYKGYNKEKTFKWYSKDSFYYRVVNNCLRIATSDSIQFCRLPLKDIEMAIKEQYQTKSKSFSGTLYRGSYLSEEEWENLKSNLHREIEMLGFLSASKEERVALNFTKADPSKKVFITILVPKGLNKEQQGFAEIEEFSHLPGEREVLFNVRSRFTVLETKERYSQELSSHHLVLLYGAQGFRKFMSEQNPSQQVSIKSFHNICCSHCKTFRTQDLENMFFISFLDAEKQVYYCKDCLNYGTSPFLCVPFKGSMDKLSIKGFLLMNSSQKQNPFYGYKCCLCGLNKSKNYFQCTECGEREKLWCNNCFKNELECVKDGHAIVAESKPFDFWCQKMSKNESDHLKFQNNQVSSSDDIFQQPEMYRKTNEFGKAIEYYEVYIKNNEAKSKDSNLATCYRNLGFVYENVRECDKALKNYSLSLDIFKSLYGENHYEIICSYSDLAVIFQNFGEYKKALEYFFKALDIGESLYGKKHPKLATLNANIGLVYFDSGEFKKALEYFFQSLEIFKSVDGESHPDVAKCYNHIGNTYNAQKKYDLALEYHFKSLDIRKSLRGEIHFEVANSYNNLGISYAEKGQYKRAIEYYIKGLDIRKIVYGEIHQDVGSSYNNLGDAYEKQGNINQAEECFLKNVRIEEASCGEDRLLLAVAYNNFGGFLGDQGKTDKALEYCLKALEIRKSIHEEEKHLDFAYSYGTLGKIYQKRGENEKALKYFFSALEIFKSADGESYPEVAEIYSNLGDFFENQKDYKTALEYCLKSLEVLESIHGKNHPDLAISCTKLGNIYQTQQEYEKAKQYYLEALDIFKLSESEESFQTRIAASYRGLGEVYENQGEYEKAKEYYMQSLNLLSSVFDDNNSEIKSISSKIETIISILECQPRK